MALFSEPRRGKAWDGEALPVHTAVAPHEVMARVRDAARTGFYRIDPTASLFHPSDSHFVVHVHLPPESPPPQRLLPAQWYALRGPRGHLTSRCGVRTAGKRSLTHSASTRHGAACRAIHHLPLSTRAFTRDRRVDSPRLSQLGWRTGQVTARLARPGDRCPCTKGMAHSRSCFQPIDRASRVQKLRLSIEQAHVTRAH